MYKTHDDKMANGNILSEEKWQFFQQKKKIELN